MLGSAKSEQPRLTNHGIIFEDFQPMWSRYVNVMNGRTTCRSTAALCVAPRGKNRLCRWNFVLHSVPRLPLAISRPICSLLSESVLYAAESCNRVRRSKHQARTSPRPVVCLQLRADDVSYFPLFQQAILEKFQMAISPQPVVRCTSCLVLGWGFRGRRI